MDAICRRMKQKSPAAGRGLCLNQDDIKRLYRNVTIIPWRITISSPAPEMSKGAFAAV